MMRISPPSSIAVISASVVSAIASLCVALPAIARPAFLTANSSSSPINFRSAPSTQSSIRSDNGRVGDAVDILNQLRTIDGHTWYHVTSGRTGARGWVRGDLISFTRPIVSPPAIGGRTENGVSRVESTPRRIESLPLPTQPIPSETSRPTQTAAPTLEAYQRNPQIQSYSNEAIEYFLEVAMGAEYGNAAEKIRKWAGPIRIRVNGRPTAEDQRTLDAVIGELRSLTNLEISRNDRNPNLEIFFVPESEFRQHIPSYRPINFGYGTVSSNNGTITGARILVSSVGLTQRERSHLIREEVTQSLGLMRDSWRYPDSIFYQGWTDTTEYAAIDRVLIQMLYRPDVLPAMTGTQVASLLRGSNTATVASCDPRNAQIALDFSIRPCSTP